MKFPSRTIDRRNQPLLLLTIQLFKDKNKLRSKMVALSLAEILAQRDEPGACRIAAAAYDWGVGRTRDVSKAFCYWKRGALLGDSYCQASLGYAYETGLGTVKDQKAAMRWYRKAARNGDVDAQFNIGQMYQEGRACSRNPKTAFSWLLMAAKRGHPEAACNVGVAYENGTDVLRNIERANHWYMRAAKAGDELAKRNLRRLGREANRKKYTVGGKKRRRAASHVGVTLGVQ